MQYTEIVMERPTLDGLIPPADGTDCVIRGYESGDDVSWRHIQSEADHYNVIGSNLFAKEFGSVALHHTNRILFAVTPTNEPIGTAAAWWGASPLDEWGRVHWVAVLPGWQRRGIGRKLLVATCHRLSHLGHRSAFLTTSPVRIEALRLYLSLGFLPRISRLDDRNVWRKIASALGDKALLGWLETK